MPSNLKRHSSTAGLAKRSVVLKVRQVVFVSMRSWNLPTYAMAFWRAAQIGGLGINPLKAIKTESIPSGKTNRYSAYAE